MAHSIDQARATGLFEAVVVSSDDADILAIAEAAGAVCVQRPAELATDTAGKLPAIRHCVQSYQDTRGQAFDIVVDLDVTSPLRQPEDILACVDLIETGGAGNVITAMPARRSPYFNLVERASNGRPVLSKTLANGQIARRQDSPDCFDMNASIYAWRTDVLLNNDRLFLEDTALYVMPEKRSIDIDSPLDFAIVKALLEGHITV